VYYQQCLACHGEMMNGQDQAPPLVGPQFSSIWNGESLWALVQRIDTMPPNMPGSLSRQDNVDVLTYILWYNGLPLGDGELGTEQKDLAEILFETPYWRAASTWRC
jgi:cytochrome c